MIIRAADEHDLDAILAIYNDAILTSTALWSDDPVDRTDREAWYAEHRTRGHPILVAEVDGEIVGYASYGPWRARMGYRKSVEDSVYIRTERQGIGVGRQLLTALIEHARSAGYHVMIADIETSNEASIALHARLGFEACGVIREVGIKFGRWLDLMIMRLPLAEPALSRVD
jgi:L-amino acid N-acyltransferase YncA